MGLLELLIVILVLAWIGGALVFPIGTSLIHLLLLIAVVVLIVRIIQGRPVA